MKVITGIPYVAFNGKSLVLSENKKFLNDHYPFISDFYDSVINDNCNVLYYTDGKIYVGRHSQYDIKYIDCKLNRIFYG